MCGMILSMSLTVMLVFSNLSDNKVSDVDNSIKCYFVIVKSILDAAATLQKMY